MKVSRLKEKLGPSGHADQQLSLELQPAFDLMQKQLGRGFVWPDRDDVTQQLAFAARLWLTNTRVDVTDRLVDRMERRMFLELERVISQSITKNHLWTIARRVVSTLVWKEKEAVANARARGQQTYPSMPPYKPPTDINELLGAAGLTEPPQLDDATKRAIWDAFQGGLLAHIDREALPICPSNFGQYMESKE